MLACLAMLLVVASMGGCNLLPEVKDPLANLTAEQLYRQAKDAMAELPSNVIPRLRKCVEPTRHHTSSTITEVVRMNAVRPGNPTA